MTPWTRLRRGEEDLPVQSSRTEAFSDGVLAIAITLLVLDLAVPAREELVTGHESLAAYLSGQWPSYAAYVVSFMVIGIIWVNHHALFSLVKAVDRVVMFANLLVLLVVSAIPFPTRLLAEYLTAGADPGTSAADSRTAALVYGGTMLAMSVVYTLLHWAVTRRADLLRPGVDPVVAQGGRRRFGAGMIAYLVTFGLGFVSAYAVLAASFLIAVYYCFDQLGGDQRRAVSSD